MNDMLTATEIDAWAKENPRKAQEILPELIIRLILCASSKVLDYNFPIEKGIQFSGYDGVLDSEEATSYYPKGKSVWEFGTNDDAIGKFKSDIEKRSADSLGIDMSSTAFVFATLKIWNHKTSIEEIRNEYMQKYNWKEIRIIDGSKIALWIQSCTAVAVWFSNVVGKYISGVRTVEEYWVDICDNTFPKLNKEYFLLGRDSEIAQINQWLESKKGSYIIRSESVLESTLFAISCLMEQDDGNHILYKKALVVESPDAWDILIANECSDSLLIPIFNFTEDIRCPAEMFLILPVEKYSPISKITRNINSVTLEMRSKADYHKALETLGFELSQFSKIDTETKRNFLPLYRMITTIPMRKKPKWVSEADTKSLIPAFLAGGWNGDVGGDKEIIEILAGCKYEEYIQNLNKWLTMEDAPIFKVFNTYQIVSCLDMWTFLFDSLTESEIRRVREAVLTVFSVENPKFDLPKDQWVMAPILGKKSKYSGILLQGLTISLILFSEQDGLENNCNISSTKQYVYTLVGEILGSINTWKQWNSIAPSLTLLTEASPLAFLEKVEQEVTNEKSELWVLFEPVKDFLTEHSYYTYVLWSLEQLVWYDTYAVRAINLLVALSEKQFKYTLANTPISSLYEIFCTWYPQTCLNCEQRIELLTAICKLYPVTGNELIGKLLPTGHATCGTIQKPRWHSFENEFKEGVTDDERSTTLKAISDIAIEYCNSKDQWETIINHSSFFFKYCDTWVNKLSLFCQTASKDEKTAIINYLRKEISRNRKYPASKWAISEASVGKMESVFREIEPDGIEKYDYLFKHNPDLLHPIPFNQTMSNFKEHRKYLQDIRIQTINEILDAYGTDCLIEFSLRAESIDELSETIVDTVFNKLYVFPAIMKIKASNKELYRSVLWRLYCINGLEGLLNSIKDLPLSNEEIADILCQCPLKPEIWDYLSDVDEGISKYYWEHISTLWLPDEVSGHLDYFLDQLLKYSRPFSAVQMVAFSKYSNSSMIMRILKCCCELQKHTEPNGGSLSKIPQHDILNLFETLYSDQNVELDKLVQLEIAFISYFKFTATPKGIIKRLQNSPIEYVDLITYSYKPDDESHFIEEERSPEQQRLAYEIIQMFTTLPGDESGAFDERKLIDWVAAAEEYATSIGYKRSFHGCLGRLLSYAPNGTDGFFPHEAIRNYFERFHDDVVVNNFVSGKYSQRGVHIVTGGMEEKEISKKYHESAAKMRISYPHSAAVLDKLAECYWQESIYEQKNELMDFRD